MPHLAYSYGAVIHRFSTGPDAFEWAGELQMSSTLLPNVATREGVLLQARCSPFCNGKWGVQTKWRENHKFIIPTFPNKQSRQNKTYYTIWPLASLEPCRAGLLLQPKSFPRWPTRISITSSGVNSKIVIRAVCMWFLEPLSRAQR